MIEIFIDEERLTSMGTFLKGAIRMKPQRDLGRSRFLQQGAPWVYSNELQMPPRDNYSPGDWVSLESAEGQTLGYGFFNAHSLISFRVFERAPFRNEEQTRALFFRRLDAALRLRHMAYPEQARNGTQCFRLTFGESDGVPGFILDLFRGGQGGGVAVMQCHAAGADGFMVWAQQWLDERMGITCGVARNDLDVRDREHAPRVMSTWGQVPADVYAEENGVRFFFDVLKGQKTGFFYDHRDNRRRLAEYAASGKWGEKPRFLDCFSYVGSWGLALAKACPTATVVCADASAEALLWVKRNAEENGLKGRVEALETDLLADKGVYAADSYQIVVSDPPAMTSSAKQAEEGKRAHEKCFGLAEQATAPEGITAFAACSFHLSWEDFLEVCHRGARKRGHALQLFELGRQAADHPMLSALPETRYLKCAFGRRLDGNLQ